MVWCGDGEEGGREEGEGVFAQQSGRRGQRETWVVGGVESRTGSGSGEMKAVHEIRGRGMSGCGCSVCGARGGKVMNVFPRYMILFLHHDDGYPRYG